MSKDLDNSENQAPENGNDPEPTTHQKQDNSKNQSSEDLGNTLKAKPGRYGVINFDNYVEALIDESNMTGRPSAPPIDPINDISPIPSLEKLKRTIETDVANLLRQQQGPEVVTRIERAFYILVGTGIGDFLWTGDIKLLLTMLAFFLALALKLLNGHLNS